MSQWTHCPSLGITLAQDKQNLFSNSYLAFVTYYAYYTFLWSSEVFVLTGPLRTKPLAISDTNFVYIERVRLQDLAYLCLAYLYGPVQDLFPDFLVI